MEPPVKRSQPQRVSDHREALREDFWYSCAYCTLTELEAQGIEFEVDHYLPTSRFPKLAYDYDNKMYCCSKCNRNKGDYVSDERSDLGLIRPDRDVPDEHLRIDGDDLIAASAKGEVSIDVLRLNRRALRTLRALRRQIADDTDYVSEGVRGLRRWSVDRIRNDLKWKFEEAKERAVALGRDVLEAKERWVEAIARSPLVDVDATVFGHTEARRSQLDELHAIAPRARVVRTSGKKPGAAPSSRKTRAKKQR